MKKLSLPCVFVLFVLGFLFAGLSLKIFKFSDNIQNTVNTKLTTSWKEIYNENNYFDIVVIGGADGPTSIFLANKISPYHLLVRITCGIPLIIIGIIVLIKSGNR